MKKTFIRAAFLALVLLPPPSGAGAQSAPIDFDALPRRQAPRDTVARPKKPTVATPAKVRVDTVIRSRVDTVRVVRVDTLKLTTIVSSGESSAKPAQVAPAPAVATPTFTPGGLTQVTFTGGDAVRSTYRLRRVELKVTADLGNKAQAIMMVDAAKALALNTTGAQPAVTQSSRMLQDAYITMPVRRMTVEAGQMRLPLGYEGAMSASSLETVERALMESDKSRSASFGDVRDAGIAVRRSWRAVDYRLGVFNGSGETMNDVDRQVGKAVVGSLAFHPASIPGVRVGLSGATSGRGAGDNPTRDRIGADVRLVRGPAAVQMEVMAGQDAAVHRLGYYALATVTARPGFKLVSRVDVWDPDLSSDVYPATNGECDYLGGLTWLPAGTRLKLQLNLVRRTYSVGAPSSTVVLSQLQASW